MILVKREVLDLEKLFSDPVWSVKAAKAKTLEEFTRVLIEFGRIHGYKIKILKEGGEKA